MLLGMDNVTWGTVSNREDFLELFCYHGGFDKRPNGLANCLSGIGDIQSAEWANILGLMGSFMNIGAAVSCMSIAPTVTERYGRKASIFTGCILVQVGLLVMTMSRTVTVMSTGRIVLGLGIGLIPYTLTMYISEVSPKEIRGSMTSMFQVMVMVGIMVSLVLSIPQSWPWWAQFIAPMVPNAILVLGLVFSLPESPRWLLQQNRTQEALEVLTSVREGLTPVEVQLELEEMEFAIQQEELQKESASWSALLKPGMWQRVVAVFGVMFFQQMTGINIFVIYGNLFLKSAGLIGQNAVYGNMLLQGANAVGTLLMVVLIDKYGRRKLLISSSFMQAVAFVAVAVILIKFPELSTSMGWVVVAILAVYNFSFGFAWGGIPWVYPSEIFPASVKARGMAIASLGQYAFATAISYGFPVINHALGLTNCMFLFVGFLIGSMFFVAIFMPETSGLALEDMDEIFENRKLCSMSHFMCNSRDADKDDNRNKNTNVNMKKERAFSITSKLKQVGLESAEVTITGGVISDRA